MSLTNYEQVQGELSRLKAQTPFAMSLGLNRTVSAAKKKQIAEIPQRFTLRTSSARSLFTRAVQVTPSTKQNLVASVETKAPGGGQIGWRSDDRLMRMFLRQELGGESVSTALYRAGNQLVSQGFYLPSEGLRGPSTPVPRYLYPKAIGVALRRQVDGGEGFAGSRKKKSKRFSQATSFFVIPGVGIFRREHHGEHTEVDSVWFFHHRIRIKPRLRFIATVEAEVMRVLPSEMQRAFTQALRTARP
jgi:hypothetical protein